MNSMINRRTCPLCGCGEYSTLVSLPYSDDKIYGFIARYYGGRIPEDVLKGSDFEIRECLSCGLLRHGYILSGSLMFQLYENWIDRDDSLRKKTHDSGQLYSQYAQEMEAVLKLSGKAPLETYVLDYGMGWGYWSRMAAAFNMNVTGYELSAVRIAHARKMGVKTIKNLNPKRHSFDFINAHQVFEHGPSPAALLKKLAGLLKSGGVIRISVPNAETDLPEMIKNGWRAEKNSFHPLEHINAFTNKTLLKLGETAALTEIKGAPLSHLTQIYFRKS